METIEVNGKKYYSEKSSDLEGDIKIVVLQRGWCLVGYFKREGSDCTLSSASVIRLWGTKKGLGELALLGPRDRTILDPCGGKVSFDNLTMVFSLDVDQDIWVKEL